MGETEKELCRSLLDPDCVLIFPWEGNLVWRLAGGIGGRGFGVINKGGLY